MTHIRKCTKENRCNNIGPYPYQINKGYCYVCWAYYYRRDIRVLMGGPAHPIPLPNSSTVPKQVESTSIESSIPTQTQKDSNKSIYPKSTICDRLGKRLTFGTCVGKCNHVCEEYDENLKVKLHLDKKAEEAQTTISPKNYAIPSITCVDCPGKQLDL